MDNDQSSQEYWIEQAEFLMSDAGQRAHKLCFVDSFTREEIAVLALTDQIKEQHEESKPELTGVFADLMTDALAEVNWREIAEHLIEAVKDEEAHEQSKSWNHDKTK